MVMSLTTAGLSQVVEADSFVVVPLMRLRHLGLVEPAFEAGDYFCEEVLHETRVTADGTLYQANACH